MVEKAVLDTRNMSARIEKENSSQEFNLTQFEDLM